MFFWLNQMQKNVRVAWKLIYLSQNKMSLIWGKLERDFYEVIIILSIESWMDPLYQTSASVWIWTVARGVCRSALNQTRRDIMQQTFLKTPPPCGHAVVSRFQIGRLGTRTVQTVAGQHTHTHTRQQTHTFRKHAEEADDSLWMVPEAETDRCNYRSCDFAANQHSFLFTTLFLEHLG